MCICFFCISRGTHDHFKFTLAFNREEFTQRATKPLGEFEEDKNIIGGRDLKEKGTWLAINKKTGNIAFLTNYSDFNTIFSFQGGAKYISRGKLIYDFVRSDFYNRKSPQEGATAQEQSSSEKESLVQEQNSSPIQQYGAAVVESLREYRPFNLIVGNLKSGEFYHVGNFPKNLSFFKLDPGNYTMCNLRQFNKELEKKQEFGTQQFLNINKELEQGLEKVNIEDSHKKKILSETSDNNIQNTTQKSLKLNFKRRILELMLDQRRYNRNPFRESSIYFPNYFNLIFWKYRQTKSTTFIAVDRDNNVEIVERTYSGIIDEKSKLPIFSEIGINFKIM